ncbi:hypothetical protein [Streptomyces hokutonensis]
MSGRDTLWALRITMWVLIVAAVPLSDVVARKRDFGTSPSS